MTVLLTAAALRDRGTVAAGALRPLCESLALDLESVLARDVFIPAEKARMTRRGGRCEFDGTMLEFDPLSPRAHRCPQCGATFDDETHYRWWIMGYQLWLAERAVHAAVQYALRGDPRHEAFARTVLEGYADRYLEYANKDNVLGPTRPFFSTYLESIWMLQLVVALDLLEMSAGARVRGLGARVRDRLIEPSATLIASYDEGLSNRQVWNNAAIIAAARLLDRTPPATALTGPSGLTAHLTRGLLPDGTWYEGENYHLFAHRGLWYAVMTASAAGIELDPGLVARFDEAFATPFVTALPDYTFPSRRDAQYRVSLRQWRFAELAELGLVRQPDDERLTGALATLYDGSVARGDTGRARSTAEAERNTPATALTRADLGWRSLLFAMPALPVLAPARARSALLPGQGLAILRREGGALYAALDYGHSGAGHGHPDRLNVLLVRGDHRWLDDVGTASYVDPSLHWYRSTLAHNAPLVNGRSQRRVHGALSAYEERGGAGWVRAFVSEVSPGVRLERTLVAMPNYVVDELAWRAERSVQLDLPFHVDGDMMGVAPWSPAIPNGGTDPEDGFSYLQFAETTSAEGDVRLAARLGAATANVYFFVDGPHAWWRAVSIGAPGAGPARFHFVRARGRRGTITAVWDLESVVARVSRADGVVTVTLRDGTRHEHRADADGWHVSLEVGEATSSIALAGLVTDGPRQEPASPPRRQPIVLPTSADRALVFDLGASDYRRSEVSWAEAGKPVARVSVWADDGALATVVRVTKPDVWFAPACDWNALDNEHPDTNSDGVQIHVNAPPTPGNASEEREVAWVLVPDPESGRVRVSARASAGDVPAVHATWHREPDGYEVGCRIPLHELGVERGSPFLLGVVVNDMAPDRERRRGQLVLGGAAGEFVYLRGDRLSADYLLPFVVPDA